MSVAGPGGDLMLARYALGIRWFGSQVASIYDPGLLPAPGINGRTDAVIVPRWTTAVITPRSSDAIIVRRKTGAAITPHNTDAVIAAGGVLLHG